MANPRRVLVPLDGSTASTSALEHAVALAEHGPTTVDVIHVNAPHDRFSFGSTAPLAPEAEEQAQREMLAAVARAKAKIGDRVSFRTEQGEPLLKLLEIARDGHYDLIVMGTHGRSGRLRTLLGSVADGVIRNAPCPVLTVREPGGEYEGFAERVHHTPSVAEAEPAVHQR
jgi:nucleotide-binding universal stress UspA family protein